MYDIRKEDEMQQSGKPLSFWAWNGDMTSSEIAEQLEGFFKQGFGGVFMHARAGLSIPYMQENWFRAVDVTIEKCKELGLEVWIYDEDGWPSGYAGGLVNGCGVEYQMKRLEFGNIVPENAYLIASYKKSENGIILSDDANYFAYYYLDKDYVDLLNPMVTNQFILSTHERYKERYNQYFGNVIKGIFTDEPQLAMLYVWSFALSEEFKRLYNQNILDDLPLLIEQSYNADVFRKKFYDTVLKLYYTNFTCCIENWCKCNNLIFTGHFSAEDGLCGQYLVNGGVMSNYAQMSQPGIDFLGRRLTSPVLLRQIASIKNQFNKEKILSETFGCSGWNTTFGEFAWIWGYQCVHGVNLPCLHISAYSIEGVRKRDYPAFFSYQEPWWNKFHYFAAWMKNINNFVSMGISFNKTLVLNPIKDIAKNLLYSIESRNKSNQFRILLESLASCQIDFDLGDEDILKNNAEVCGGIKINEQVYSIVIVPEMDSLCKSTFKILKKFSDCGGIVVFTNRYPDRIDAIKSSEIKNLVESITNNMKVQNLLDSSVMPELLVMNKAELWSKYFSYISYKREVEFVAYNDNLIKNVIINVKKLNNGYAISIFNPSCDSKKSGLIRVENSKNIKRINLKTNSITFLQKVGNLFELEVEPMEFIALITGTDENIIAQSEFYCGYIPKLTDFTVCDKNVLTIDRFSYSKNGEKSSEIMSLPTAQKELNNLELNIDDCVTVRYVFNSLIKDVELAIEAQPIHKILINGNEINKITDLFYIDKAIKKYNISKFVNIGKNTIDAVYKMDKNLECKNIDNLFETQRNRFKYDIEPEAIYILGNFDVKASGILTKMTNYIRVSQNWKLQNNDKDFFQIVEAQPKNCYKDLTEQGMWFYRGESEYIYKVDKTGGQAFLSIGEVKSPVIEVVINGNSVGAIFDCHDKFELTEFLTKDINTLKLLVSSSNRNVLGPHHHYKGEPNFVGVHTFKGEKGFEDDVVTVNAPQKTWTDDYSFTPYGIAKVKIEIYK